MTSKLLLVASLWGAVGGFLVLHALVICWGASFACTVIVMCGKSVCRRLELIWKMSHHFDYAERRQRRRMLKS